MFSLIQNLFNSAGVPRRWECGELWTQEPYVGWLHIVSDVATFMAYFAVPAVVAFFVAKRPELKFHRLLWLFLGLVFFSCGTVHLLEAAIFWWPAYRLSALLKLITAGVSLTGVVVLCRALPRLLSLKPPEEVVRAGADG